MENMVKKSILINATKEAVWEALTDKEIIKEYLFGTETNTDWKKGSPIIFTGNYEGYEYRDGGTILDIVPNEKLVYTYWASMSGVEDIPENYATVTYRVKEADGATELAIEQANSPTESMHKEADQHWPITLQKIKEIVEQGANS